MSADSGVPTFRGEEGFYNGLRAEELLSFRTMRRSPEVIQRFIDNMRAKMGGAKPNAAHMMIARLGNKFGGRVVHFTQNIDPLVELAGYDGSVHLHGFVTRMRSIGNSKVTEDVGFTRYWEGDPSEAPPRGFKFRCPKTGSLMRPDVVLFDEMGLDYPKLYSAAKRLRAQDTFVVIGTQGNIYPIREAINIALKSSAKTVLNNLHSSSDIEEILFDHVFMERAVDVASDIEALVRERLQAD
ncbi:SIR2 family NAD-dependent protein deacylase [Mesorhizobium sp. SP-1A]|uniref:SIR2 family NAD-dependent protein deacylase n=1 Tax=Mesorhizobium sp. SP-1A TaxID=3077840 RepID=UPI0028F7493F|nr:Sir2 family NAD-dependent protein deacetylase [Mesorhizobium sp. SP-1A]